MFLSSHNLEPSGLDIFLPSVLCTLLFSVAICRHRQWSALVFCCMAPVGTAVFAPSTLKVTGDKIFHWVSSAWSSIFPWSCWLSDDSDRSHHPGWQHHQHYEKIGPGLCPSGTKKMQRKNVIFHVLSQLLKGKWEQNDRRSEWCFKPGKLFQNTVRNSK